jgi:hypothetical protein
VTLALRQQQHRQQGDDQASDGAAARGRSQNGRQQEEQRQAPERAHGAAAAVRSRIAARGCRGLAKEQYGQRHGHGDVAGEVIAVGKGADDPPAFDQSERQARKRAHLQQAQHRLCHRKHHQGLNQSAQVGR